MMAKFANIKQAVIFYRSDNRNAAVWAKRVRAWLTKNQPKTRLASTNPELVLVIGGDGTILEAARRYEKSHPIIFGFNTGNVGFLASVREEANFLPALQKFFKGQYSVDERMMLNAEVKRKGKSVFAGNALNEIAVQNPMGMVEAEVNIEKYPVQYIRGSGILVATATGSTAYNLSAHGPIVMPEIKCLILTEILDHNVPTPSIVIKHDREITIKILSFRKRGLLSISKTRHLADTILIADGETIFPLRKDDLIFIKKSPHFVRFAEMDKSYFFKSLQEKFGFR